MITNAPDIHEAGKKRIVEIIGDYVPLKKKGTSYLGCCPFHEEKTPSFSVSPTKGVYKCFGCGQSGDAVNFLMEHQGLSYPEALRLVGNQTQTKPIYETNLSEERIKAIKEESAQIQKLVKLLNDTYANIPLASQEQVKAYLDRDYTEEIIKQFDLKIWDQEVFKVLTQQQAKAMGLMSEKNKFFLYNRILFPIKNLSRENPIRGIAGRRPKKDDKKGLGPKYINPKECLVYNKSNLLYGLDQAKKRIQTEKRAYIVEGYTDVISMHQADILNTVGACGTGFTFEMAKLLGRFTKESIFLFDGDQAGLKAAERAVLVGAKAGLRPKVLLLDEGHDPDSFIRSHSKRAFETFEEEKIEDGIIWYGSIGYDKDNPFSIDDSYKRVAELLIHLNEALQDSYINNFAKKWGKNAAKNIRNKIEELVEKQLSKVGSELTEKQERDQYWYGVYEHQGQYFVLNENSPKEHGFAITNFVINPIMLIKGSGSKNSFRIMEVVNNKGQSFTYNFESRNVYEMSTFAKEIEGWGNFLFNEFCKQQHFIRIKRKLYDDVPTCYPINTLGHHSKGFYAWGNGISYDGKFYPVNEYGVVEYDEHRFFLPAFSKIKTEALGDDSEGYEDHKLMSYYPGKTLGFKEWTGLMHKVHEDNGMMGVCYYLAALFRDIIYNRFTFFPHLFLFGPPSAGKSFMARSVSSLSGKPRQGFHLAQGSTVGFWLRLEQACNSIAWFEEYSNDVPYKRIEAIKGAYDGSGHEKANRDNINQIERRKVKSACVLTGQQQPTQDIAAFKRCICLNFPKRVIGQEQIAIADQLVSEQQSGRLSQLTIHLLQYRTLIEDQFSDCFDTIRSHFKEKLSHTGIDIEERILNNYIIPLATMRIISQKEEFAFSYEKMEAFTLENIIRQSEAISQEDEVSTWWRIVQYMIEKNLITNMQYNTRRAKEISLWDPVARKDYEKKKFETEKKLFCISLTVSHQEYQKLHQQNRGKKGLDIEALKYYLRQSDGFIGERKNESFGSKKKMAWIFDLEKIPLEIGIEIPH